MSRWPAGSPVGELAVQELGESLAVVALEVVRHLVDDDVLKAIRVALGEFDVEPKMVGLAVAGPPLGLHAPDGPLRHGYVELGLPPVDQVGDESVGVARGTSG